MITADDLAETITAVLKAGKDWGSPQFIRDEMKIVIDERKSIQLTLLHDIQDTEDYRKTKLFKPIGDIQTEIVLHTYRSVFGTEICVKLVKNLQKKFPRSVYVDDAQCTVGGSDIQNIKVDKKFMRKLRKTFESDITV